MKCKSVIFLSIFSALPLYAQSNTTEQLNQQIQQLERQTQQLQAQLHQIQHELVKQAPLKTKISARSVKKSVAKHKTKPTHKIKRPAKKSSIPPYHNSRVYVHTLNGHPESVEFYPTALLAEGKVVTFIGGTPVVTAPYLGSRPSYNGSDYIVNISSINRDLRLMEQRRQLYRAYHGIGYPVPNTPIIALSGKAEPVGIVGNTYSQDSAYWDMNWDLGSAEVDVAAALNKKVQAYISFAYDPAIRGSSNQRIAGSGVGLGLGFINIGDLDETPFYFTAGQLYVPFGRYSSAMVSAPLPMIMGRTKSRPFILGYKSQGSSGPFAAIYGFKADTTSGNTGVGGANFGYEFDTRHVDGEVGASFISSIDNSGGMQMNSASQNTGNFAGFAALLHGSEAVKPVPAVDGHVTIRFRSYNLTAEWLGVTNAFRTEDLSFNGFGAHPQALQLEAGKTFIVFSKPSTLAVGFQWSKEALALRIPEKRFSAVFNISIWKDTVESLEYRHDIDYNRYQFANGSAPTGVVNTNTVGTGKSGDMVLAQIGVYF